MGSDRHDAGDARLPIEGATGPCNLDSYAGARQLFRLWIKVEVTSEGFQPSRVTLGADRRVVFRRVVDGTCATAVVFPGLGIEKALPLNTDVTVELPPGSHGKLGFQCGMGMYRGKVVAE